MNKYPEDDRAVAMKIVNNSTVKRANVFEEIGRLNDLVDQIGFMVNGLKDNLEPILAPEDPHAQSVPSSAREVSTPLLRSLADTRYRLESLRDFVGSVAGRVVL